jgi:DNA-binding GntR family transcriptional regulator
MKQHARRHEVQGYYAGNLAFHWAVVEAADNPHLATSYRGIVQQLHLSRLKNLSRDIGMQISLVEHEQIIAALVDGDAPRCQALQVAHVADSHRRLVALEHGERTPR